jgi:hypothetical protein
MGFIWGCGLDCRKGFHSHGLKFALWRGIINGTAIGSYFNL